MKHFENIQSIGEHYDIKLKHPLIDILKYEEVNNERLIKYEPIKFGFYTISFVKSFNGFIKIGGTKFTGKNGVLHFIEPGQVYSCNSTNPWEGFQVLIHPKIFNEYFNQKKINMYDFLSYEVNETLLLVEEEEMVVSNLLEMAWNEFNKKEDSFSIPIVLSYLSTLLNLAERFYARQFESRKKEGNQLTKDFIDLLDKYYSKTQKEEISQPTVQYFADSLNVTANYLSDSIKHDTGSSALSLVHQKIIEEAKYRLKSSSDTVSEISYQLGFEYPNYFSRLFKRKTNQSPTEFRASVKSI